MYLKLNANTYHSFGSSYAVKERTNLRIKKKYLCPDVLEASGRRESAKGFTVSRSNSSLSLYSSASAPNSPLTRKVLDC